MGIVIARVKVAQGEDLRAFTTTRPITARRIVMMASTASCAMKPPRSLTSSRAIWPIDFPSRRIEQKRMTKSCTQPANAAPAITQSPKDHPASDAEDAIHFAALLDLMNCAISAFSLASDGG